MNKHMIIIAATVLVVAACAAEPSLDSRPEAERTFDGLVSVRNSNFREAWADPDVDFSQYDKIMLGEAQFEFRAVKKTRATSSSIRSGNTTEFWIDEKGREKLIETVTGIFREELQSTKGFSITEERGPSTLIIVGGLHDIVSRVPPELIGAGEIYLSSVGEATLVLEARDSLSGETIYRAVDRRRIERYGDAIEANTVQTWVEVRRWARRWATRLRSGLESIHE